MTAAFDYARVKARADAMIARFGQTGVLKRPGAASGPAYNPTPGSPTTYPVTFVVTDYDVREIDGTRILATDKKVLMAVGSLAIEPTTTDKLPIAGADHSIVDVQPLNPGGTVVLYQLQVRR